MITAWGLALAIWATAFDLQELRSTEPSATGFSLWRSQGCHDAVLARLAESVVLVEDAMLVMPRPTR